MTVSNTNAVATASGNNAQTLWPYGFYIPDSNSIVVSVTSPAPNNLTTVIPSSGYSVSGLGSPGGGTVTYPLTGSPLAAGWTISIARNTALTQNTSFTNQSSVAPPLIEAALDKLTMALQEAHATIAVLQAQGLLVSLPLSPANGGTGGVITGAQLRAALTSLGLYYTVEDLIPASDPQNRITQDWLTGASLKVGSALYNAIQTGLGYTNTQMANLLLLASTL